MRTFVFIFIMTSLAACTQGEGEVCQSDRDCDDGLVCTLDEDDRGFCQDPDDVEVTPPDNNAGEGALDPDPDAGADASVDGGGDAGLDASFDAGPDDDAG